MTFERRPEKKSQKVSTEEDLFTRTQLPRIHRVLSQVRAGKSNANETINVCITAQAVPCFCTLLREKLQRKGFRDFTFIVSTHVPVSF